jgi:NAD(P)-dependent dehydrogenase (short-subunit alcohol dehydrogenase family)
VRRALLTAAALAAAAVVGARALRRSRSLDFAGRVVLITGGSRGLGLELARRFAAEGAKLALLARDRGELERAVRELYRTSAGGPDGIDVELLRCDLREPDEVEQSVDQVLRRFGRLDVLVNNAGTIRVGPLDNLTLEEFRQEMEINFFGALNATLAALPHLRQAGQGRIVNVTSIGGRIPVPHLLPYTASKFAFVGFSETLGAELGRHGIRVTTVTPGLMRTGSPYRAMFTGRRKNEFRWFLLASSLPLLSIPAARAARRIVEACRHGDASLIVPAYLRLPIAAKAMAPGTVSRLAGLVNSLLPRPAPEPADGRLLEGREVQAPEESPAYAALTRRAARRNNELG